MTKSLQANIRPMCDLPLFTQFLQDDETALLRLVLEILSEHVGARSAITAEKIAKCIGSNARHVRAIIEDLISDGYLIGATSTGPCPGFFMIETVREWEVYLDDLDNRAKKILVRRKHIRQAGERRFGRRYQPFLFEE